MRSPDTLLGYKLLVIVCVLLSFGCFLFSVSFYLRDLPKTPRPELGRVYPLNNHGISSYLTKQEDAEQNWTFAVSVLLFGVAVLVDYRKDPFTTGYSGNLLKPRPPWNHNWGP